MKAARLLGLLLALYSTEALFGISSALSPAEDDFSDWRAKLRAANYRRALKRLNNEDSFRDGAWIPKSTFTAILSASFRGLAGLIWGFGDGESDSPTCTLTSINIPSWCLNPITILLFVLSVQGAVSLLCILVKKAVYSGDEEETDGEEDSEDGEEPEELECVAPSGLSRDYSYTQLYPKIKRAALVGGVTTDRKRVVTFDIHEPKRTGDLH